MSKVQSQFRFDNEPIEGWHADLVTFPPDFDTQTLDLGRWTLA